MVDVDATPRLAPVSPPYDDETGRLLAKWMPPGVDADPLLLSGCWRCTVTWLTGCAPWRPAC